MIKSFVQMPRAGNYYLYSFDGRLLARYDVYGFCQSEYIYMGNRLIAERDHVGNRYLYYASDQINSTRVVTDDSGTVVHAQAYDPYGGIQVNWVPSFDPTPKFSGKERDTESGLDYFGARYYDNSQYRFISVDPKLVLQAAQANSQSWNLYAYCSNDPLNYIDPSGRYGFKVHYGWTKQIALMEGISEDVATTIARADILVDNPLTTGRNNEWHNITLENYANALRICETTLDPKVMGKYLHVIQDYFAHSAMVLMGSEHTPDMDDPNSNWLKSMEMAQLTLDLLRSFKERRERVLEAACQACRVIPHMPI